MTTDELRKRCDALLPGRWYLNNIGLGQMHVRTKGKLFEFNGAESVAKINEGRVGNKADREQAKVHGRLIAVARTAIPALLDFVGAVRKARGCRLMSRCTEALARCPVKAFCEALCVLDKAMGCETATDTLESE
jgi:hypothetical protein